jgi:hypothetical protein
MHASMHHEDFRKLQGRPCMLRAGDGVELPAVLAEVGERRERQGFEQFSLLFRARQEDAPQQGLYRVAIEGEAEGELFLVPIGRDGDQVSYEACFNRKPPA